MCSCPAEPRSSQRRKHGSRKESNLGRRRGLPTYVLRQAPGNKDAFLNGAIAKKIFNDNVVVILGIDFNVLQNMPMERIECIEKIRSLAEFGRGTVLYPRHTRKLRWKVNVISFSSVS